MSSPPPSTNGADEGDQAQNQDSPRDKKEEPRSLGGGFWNEWRLVEGRWERKPSIGGRGGGTKELIATPTNGRQQEEDKKETEQQREEPIVASSTPAAVVPSSSPAPPSSSSSSSSSSSLVDSSPSVASEPSPNPEASSSNSPSHSAPRSSQPSPASLCQNGEKNLLDFLKAIESKLPVPLSPEDKLKVLEWLGNLEDADESAGGGREKSPSPSMSAGDLPELRERIQRLQISRDSLSLQVSVLSRQVSLQREKISDLESLLESKRHFQYPQGQEQEEMLGQQLAELRHRYAALEKDKREAERRLRHSNNELEQLGGQHSPAQQNGGTKSNDQDELERLQMAVQKLMVDNEQKNSLIQMLRNALEEQQRCMLELSLQHPVEGSFSGALPLSFSPHPPMDINEQIRRLLLPDDPSGSGSLAMSHSCSFPAGLSASSAASPSHPRGASPFRNPGPAPPPLLHNNNHFLPASASFSSALSSHHAPLAPPPPLWRASSPPVLAPSHHLGPPNGLGQVSNNQYPHHQHHQQPAAEYPLSSRTPASPLARQLAAELDELRHSGSFGLSQQPYSSSSLPRSLHSKANNSFGSTSSRRPHQPLTGECNSSPGRGISAEGRTVNGGGGAERTSRAEGNLVDWVRRRFKSLSTPNLVIPPSRKVSRGTDRVESDDELVMATARASVPNSHSPPRGPPPSSSASSKPFRRGRRARSTLRSFLGRFAHRGNSLQDLRPSPRLSPAPSSGSGTVASLVPSSTCPRPPIRLFVDWDRSHCARWLAEFGFGDAVVGAVRSGRHLLNMSDTEMERELGLRCAIQRKRLRCMLDRIERGTEIEPADRMDTDQVMLWLDQIGLPQLRDLFVECRMDGQMLLALTAQDLVELGIHSALNHASLARGIQFLRSVDFHLHRLEKHFSPEFLSRCPIPAEVERWSHCCVGEWLRSVDLAEFTPNLAFSGLHGALMVYEPTFTAETLAEMLQIPLNKTLIRRHLITQFNSLLGQQVVGHKRDILAQPGVTQLTPGLRIRLAKRGFSLGRKKSKSEIFVDPEVRVCPAEGGGGALVNGNGAGREDEMSDV